MYSSFEIQNFRCFKKLKFSELALVNLITGKNNVGKTALLEALFLHCGSYNPQLLLSVNAFRGIEVLNLTPGTWIEHPLTSFFNQFDVSNTIELSGENTVCGYSSLKLRLPPGSIKLEQAHQGGVSILDESVTRYNVEESSKVLILTEIAKVIELEHKDRDGRVNLYRMSMGKNGIRVEPIPPAPPFQTFFQGDQLRISFSEQAKRYGELEIHGKEGIVLEILKIIEKRLKRIASVAVVDGPMLHGDIGIGRLIPLAVMGGGINRLVNFVLHIANAPNGVVLFDEIENGLHHSVMTDVWKAIALAAKNSNTQVFATTHSWECICSAYEAFKSRSTSDKDFRLHRLDRLPNDEIKVVTYDKQTLTAAIEAGLEVR